MSQLRAVLIAVTLTTLSCTVMAAPTVTYRHLTPGNPAGKGKKAKSWGASDFVGGGGESNQKPPTTTDPNNPQDGEFVFALAKSSIVLPAPDKPGDSCPKPQPSDDNDAARGKKDSKVNPQGSATDAGTDGYEASPWKRCLTATAPKAAPHADADYIYVMHTAHGLTLQPTFNADDPLLMQSIAANYKSPVATNLTRIGEEAAIGMGLYGPVGAGAAVLIGEVAHAQTLTSGQRGMLAHRQILTKNKEERDDLLAENYICPDSVDYVRERDLPERTRLLLPVSLDHSETGQFCWHEFPKGDEAYTNDGWFYRVVEETKPDDTLPILPPTYNAANAPASKILYGNDLPSDDPMALADGKLSFFTDRPRHYRPGGDLPSEGKTAYVPVAACHAVIVQIAWWTDIVSGQHIPEPNKAAHDPTEYHLSVADPRILQKVRVDKTPRTITMLPCGARVTSGQASNAGDDMFNAFTKEYQAVRSQQLSWSKDHK